MKRHYERTISGGWIAVLIPETEEEMAELERRAQAGEVDMDVSFGDKRQTAETEEGTR